jgi:hypothetical protein
MTPNNVANGNDSNGDERKNPAIFLFAWALCGISLPLARFLAHLLKMIPRNREIAKSFRQKKRPSFPKAAFIWLQKFSPPPHLPPPPSG